MIALITAAVIAACAAVPDAGPAFATLQPVTDGSPLIVAIRDGSEGRRLTIDCLDACPAPPRFSEAFDDTPLGLFQPFDREPIVVAVAAGGSAYHVRAYRLAPRIARVLDVASRAAPGVAVAADGTVTITTTERRTAAAPPGADRSVTWTWRGDRFVRRPDSRQ